MPTDQTKYMQKLVDGDVEDILPPSEDEVKSWCTFYLMYFNNEMSVAQGRRLPLNLCVKNPRPDEILEALKKLGYRSICHHVSISSLIFL